MAKFTFTGQVTVSAYTIVEADSLEAARAIAEERGVEIGGVNSGNEPEDYWIIEMADGEAQNIVHEE